MTNIGKIIFPDGPWPEGEPLEICRISGELTPEGIWLGLHVESIEHNSVSSPYDPDEESLTDFKHPSLWENYGKIILSNTYWATEDRVKTIKLPESFRFTDLDSLELNLDFPPKKCIFFKRKTSEVSDFPDVDQFYFHIYALGHGHVAHHKILIKIMNDNQLQLNWSGIMADSYFGNDTFEYPFSVEAVVPFYGLYLEPRTSKDSAQQWLNEAVANPDEWQLICKTPKHIDAVGNNARLIKK